MNSMRGGMPPRDGRGMPPPLRGGIHWARSLSCFRVALQVFWCTCLGETLFLERRQAHLEIPEGCIESVREYWMLGVGRRKWVDGSGRLEAPWNQPACMSTLQLPLLTQLWSLHLHEVPAPSTVTVGAAEITN